MRRDPVVVYGYFQPQPERYSERILLNRAASIGEAKSLALAHLACGDPSLVRIEIHGIKGRLAFYGPFPAQGV